MKAGEEMYKLFIFDLDGTLVNSLEMIGNTFNSVLIQYGLSPVELEKYKYFVGDGPEVLARRVLRHLMEKGEIKAGEEEYIFQGIYPDYLERYNGLEDDLTHPYEGVEEVLSTLKEKDIKIAICTNKMKIAAEKLVHSIFKTPFDAISAFGEDIPRKPNPDMIEKILKDLKIEKEETLYFGDTNTDMETAMNAKVDAIGVSWGFRSREELEKYQPKGIIDNPIEILNYL